MADMGMTLSHSAGEAVRRLLDAAPGPSRKDGLRIAVVPGGGGLLYTLRIDDIRDRDEVVEQTGVKVIVDPDSTRWLRGASLDYRKSPSGEGFEIRGPASTGLSRCGTAFRL